MTGACSPSPSAVVPITRRRAGACVAGRLAAPLLDWPAPDGPAASFPSAGVEAISLALKGGGGSALGGGGSTLGIRGLSGLFAGGWPLAMVNRAEISLSAWWGRSWERPFRACATSACARTAFGGAGAGVLGTGASEADAGTSAGGARLGGCVISIPRSGAHAAGGPTSIPPDEPAPDGPAASFPSAGVEAISLALKGGGGVRVGWGWIHVGYPGPQRAVRWWVAPCNGEPSRTQPGCMVGSELGKALSGLRHSRVCKNRVRGRWCWGARHGRV